MQAFDDPRSTQSEKLAIEAEQASLNGNQTRAQDLFAQAAQLEMEVAQLVPSTSPRLRGLLAVSAVALWQRAARYPETEACAHFFLQDQALCEEARLELRRLLTRCWQEADLVRELAPDQPWASLEVNLEGGLVRQGLAPSTVARDRQQAVTKMLVRVAEWQMNEPFRQRGEASQRVLGRAQIYEGSALTGSYGLQLYLVSGTPAAEGTLKDVGPLAIVQQFLTLASAAQEAPEDLAALVPDDQYRRTFLEHLHDLAPDGQKVGVVSLSCPRLLSRRAQARLEPQHREALSKAMAVPAKDVKATHEGLLKVVNLRQCQIGIEIDGGEYLSFRIQKGHHDDTIGTMLNHRVRVQAEQTSAASTNPLALDIRLIDSDG